VPLCLVRSFSVFVFIDDDAVDDITSNYLKKVLNMRTLLVIVQGDDDGGGGDDINVKPLRIWLNSSAYTVDGEDPKI